jgi:hypothetical protein
MLQVVKHAALVRAETASAWFHSCFKRSSNPLPLASMPVVSKVCNPRIARISKIQPHAELLPNPMVLVANNRHFHPRCTQRVMTA